MAERTKKNSRGGFHTKVCDIVGRDSEETRVDEQRERQVLIPFYVVAPL